MPPSAPYIIVFALGAVIGSFLNVVSLRFGTGVGVGGRSMCMSCGKPLSWYELIPVLSFLAQGGRCSGCRARISWQYPLVEATTGVLFVLVWWRYPAEPFMAALYAVAMSLLVVLAVYDLKHKILPDALVYAFDAVALATALPAHHLSTLLAGPILALPFALLWAVSRGRWIGLGDAKLVLGLGWMLGISAGVNGIVLAFWIGAGVSVIWLLAAHGRIARGTEIPFGPYLMLGALVALFWGVQVIDVKLLAALIQAGFRI